MASGIVRKLVSKYGYGFINAEGGKDLFFNQSQLQGVGYSSLKEGQEVEFEAGTDPRGRPAAVNVKLPSPSVATVAQE